MTVIQRVGSGLNVNPHPHTLALDGVFARGADGRLSFHPVGPMTDEEVAELLATVRRRVLRLLERQGVLDEDEASFEYDELSEASPSLAGIYAAGVQGRVALGQRSGRRVLRVGSEPEAPWVTSRSPLQAHLEGFDLHGAVVVDAGDRERLDHPEAPPRRRSFSWAELLARVFLIDVLECPKCQGRMKVISTIEDPAVIRKILNHLGLPTSVPRPLPAKRTEDELEELVFDFDSL